MADTKKYDIEPYEGNENYIFISFCHKDESTVFPIIEKMESDGFRIWFDAGISTGAEWPETIAEHLNACAQFIAFVSKNAHDSHNCRREITFALQKNKNFASVIIDDVKLSLGMEMQLSANQILYKNRMNSDNDFYLKLYDIENIMQCRSDSGNSNNSITDIFSSEEMEKLKNAEDELAVLADKIEIQKKNFVDAEKIIAESKIERADKLKIAEKKKNSLQILIEENKEKREKELLNYENNYQLIVKNIEKEIDELQIKLQNEKAEFENGYKTKKEEMMTANQEDIEQIKQAENQFQQLSDENLKCDETEGKRLAALKKELDCLDELYNHKGLEVQKLKEKINRIDNEPTTVVAPSNYNKRYYIQQKSTGTTAQIPLGSFVLGRSDTKADFIVYGNPAVGRAHAIVFQTEEGCSVMDNDSLNKTYLNNLLLKPKEKYPLKNGDVISLYNEVFIFTEIGDNIE